jgi:hypothetical protein
MKVQKVIINMIRHLFFTNKHIYFNRKGFEIKRGRKFIVQTEKVQKRSGLLHHSFKRKFRKRDRSGIRIAFESSRCSFLSGKL